jgi:CO/xanthine dehydrogenase Mo-binding subunit
VTPELPASLVANPWISTWLTVDGDGLIGLRVGKVELGQGIVTALTQIAAHELDVPPESVRAAATTTSSSPDEGLTAGSLSITFSGAAVRRVCAETRELFRRAAARTSGLDTAQVRLVSGVFVAPDGARIGSYADLAGAVDLHVQVGDPSLTVEFAAPTSKDLARVDLPDKVFGRPRFIHDLEFDGMVHARVVRPPAPGAHLEEVRADGVAALPGVEQVVREGDFLAVIARREGQATTAAVALAAAASWSAGVGLPDPDDVESWLRSAEAETRLIRADGARHDDGPVVVAGTFSRPYLAHASIGPSCAVARYDGGRLEVWSHSQGVFPLRLALAEALGLSPEAVVVQHAEGPGSYGHNAADDAAMDAALLAIRVPGRHVRVLWSRGDEFSWEPFGPAMVADVTASVDAQGRIADWSYRLWTNGHTARPGYAPRHSLLADAHRAGATMLPPAVDPPAERGHGAARNAEPYYDITRVDVTVHRLLTMPIRTSSLRSLGGHLNTFAIESVIDDVARATGRDPLRLRLDHLSDPRAREVLTTAAAAAEAYPLPDGHGRGIAFCRYKNRGSYCAVVADVEATDRLRVTRLTIAVDVGRVVNADGVRNQIEGGAIQATSWALLEQVRFDRHAITSTDWESYPIARFGDVPVVDVHVLDRPDEPPLGAGEATQGPVTAAIGNALADALGVRVRTLPFTPDHIVAAIDAAT